MKKKTVKKLVLAKETVRTLELALAQGGTYSGSPCQTWQGTCAGCGGDTNSAWPNGCVEQPISYNTNC